ncbi:MAG: 23S rRNA (uracil(1939)-C(5))-methyltransferase RlmD [Clostridia bacterium]|nr:23S rRNA (uracil(1939)-C(5))-methyltransferase RlmD [Clostridia bacterium]
MDLKKGSIVELEITDLNNLGNGVGRVDGKVVFVRGAVSGDVVRAKIIKVNKSFFVARLEEIVTPSSAREEDFCQAPLSCGGCVYRHISYDEELKLKYNYVKNAFLKVGISDIEVLPVISTGRVSGYRNKGQYPLAKIKGKTVAGFYASKTHNVVPAEDCAIQNPAFAEILRFVCEFADEAGWSVYDEESRSGLLRHIYLRIGERTGEIMVCLVINGRALLHSEELALRLAERFPNIVSVLLNFNSDDTNVVLGDEYKLLYGKHGITDELCGLRFFISPESFYQVNHDGAELLYLKAREMAELCGDETLADLYCGTGTIGLSMAKSVKRLCGIEIVEGAVECAKENAKRNGIDNAEFVCGDASSKEVILSAFCGVSPDVVVIDPPRKGSTKELVDTLADIEVKRIVYVSCSPDTLARDTLYFIERGYKMSSVQPVDMFPRSGHVESVMCFTHTFNN